MHICIYVYMYMNMYPHVYINKYTYIYMDFIYMRELEKYAKVFVDESQHTWVT